MVERDYDNLIQDVLDGVATPEQVARLEARVSADPATGARQTELEQVFAALGRARRFETPPELRAQILRALPPGAPGVRRNAPIESGRRLRLAYLFAAVIAAGVIGAGALTGFWKTPPGVPVSGSMMPSPGARGSNASRTGHWQAGSSLVDGRSWAVAGSRFAAFKARGGDAEIEISFDPTALAPVGVQVPPGADQAILEPGRVRFRAQDRETVVEFRELGGSPRPLRVLVRAGAQSASGELPAPPVAPATN